MSQSFFEKNYYELFNVSEDASDMEIKKAYARLVRQYSNETHPEEFMHIRKAFQVLSNPAERSEYDRRLNQQHTSDYDQQTYQSQQYQQQHSYETHDSYNHSYNNQQSQYEQQSYNNTYSYNDQQTYNQYDYSSYETYQSQNDYTDYSRPNYGSSQTQTAEKKRSYSLLGNVIFSIIISLIFTPIVGIITGIVIHLFKIPIMKVVGCIFWIFVALFVLGILLEFL